MRKLWQIAVCSKHLRVSAALVSRIYIYILYEFYDQYYIILNLASSQTVVVVFRLCMPPHFNRRISRYLSYVIVANVMPYEWQCEWEC